jgi:dolichyl-phosphate-mannose-protein mannosyltransferase
MLCAPDKKKWTVYALGALLLTSFALHLYRISYPATPVFDEAHFATYAVDYYTGTPFFDIHPPLGKLMYAEVLRLASYHPATAPQFVKWTKNAETGLYQIVKSVLDYGDFPYVGLRLLSCLFGVLLPLVFYFFLRSIGMGRAGALLAVFFVVFENALLLQTRLILMDGMYLVFGFTALAFFFNSAKSRWRPLIGGVFWGLSLGVKLIGVVFIVPALVSFYMQNRSDRVSHKPKLTAFFFAGSILFFFIALGNNIFFSVHDRLELWHAIGLGGSSPAFELQTTVPDSLPRYLVTSLTENFLEVSKNIEGATDTLHSPWYLWPVMQKPILYLKESAASTFMLKGNPVIWFSGTLAVAAAIFLALKRLKKYWRDRNEEYVKTPLILLSGYVGALLPFFTLVHRNTFLYHYFPALLFSIGLLAFFIEKLLKLDEPGPVSFRKALVLGFIAIAVMIGFLLGTPFVFGF